MPATELQQMEMDMVESMYDTFALVTADPTPEYTVLLAASENDPHELLITVKYPSEDYPETAPCEAVAESISKSRRVQTSNMNREVAAMLEENCGMHTVVMALQQFQEFLTSFAEEEEKADLIRRGEVLDAAAAAKRNPVAADPTIRLGMAVTKELFEEWSAKRKAERLKKLLAENNKKDKLVGSKLSGRQLWDNTVASAEWELFGEEGDGGDGEVLDFDTFDRSDSAQYDLEDED